MVRAAAVAAVACLIGAGAFVAGEHHQPGMTVVTGIAAIGDHEASVTTGGWTYGLQGDNVAWVDSQGTTHMGGWPACLTGPGTTRPVTLGWVPMTLPGGGTLRQVTWVDCQS